MSNTEELNQACREIEEVKKIAKKLLEGEAERNLAEKRRLGIPENHNLISGNYKVNQAFYELDRWLFKIEAKAIREVKG